MGNYISNFVSSAGNTVKSAFWSPASNKVQTTWKSPAANLHTYLGVGRAGQASKASLSKAAKAVKSGEAATAFAKTVKAGVHAGRAAGSLVGKAQDLAIGTSRLYRHGQLKNPAGSEKVWLNVARGAADKGVVGVANDGLQVAAKTVFGGIGAATGALVGSCLTGDGSKANGYIHAGVIKGWDKGNWLGDKAYYYVIRPLPRIALELVRLATGVVKMGLQVIGGVALGVLALFPASLMAGAAALNGLRQSKQATPSDIEEKGAPSYNTFDSAASSAGDEKGILHAMQAWGDDGELNSFSPALPAARRLPSVETGLTATQEAQAYADVSHLTPLPPPALSPTDASYFVEHLAPLNSAAESHLAPPPSPPLSPAVASRFTEHLEGSNTTTESQLTPLRSPLVSPARSSRFTEHLEPSSTTADSYFSAYLERSPWA